jgi:hypothetical protein
MSNVASIARTRSRSRSTSADLSTRSRNFLSRAAHCSDVGGCLVVRSCLNGRRSRRYTVVCSKVGDYFAGSWHRYSEPYMNDVWMERPKAHLLGVTKGRPATPCQPIMKQERSRQAPSIHCDDDLAIARQQFGILRHARGSWRGVPRHIVRFPRSLPSRSVCDST